MMLFVCKKCGSTVEPNYTETPDMVHEGRLDCPVCKGLIKWVPKPKNLNRRRRTSKFTIELGYCQWCLRKKGELGKHETLHLHHMIPICFGGPDEKENLLTLCSACHGAVHHAQRYLNLNLKNPIEGDF